MNPPRDIPRVIKKRPRTRNGCLTCRQRRVKCDEKRPLCEHCAVGQRELQCTWPSVLNAPYKKRRARHSVSNTRSESSPETPAAEICSPSPTAGPAATVAKRKKSSTEFTFGYDVVPDRVRVEMMLDPYVNPKAPLTCKRAFLHPYFPSLDERLIIRHYLSRTVHNILAFQSLHRPFNPWLLVHAPLAFRHLPGVSAACDALRTAMLAVGAVHMRYCDNPQSQEAAWTINKSSRPKILKLVDQALSMPDGTARHLDSDEVEMILAALLSCTLASSLAADDSWFELLAKVFALVERLGGAQHLLEDSPRDRLSPSRFILEQLAIRDVFGCIGTGSAPTILREAFTPWFFESESWSKHDVEWESVERLFGVSRGMVDLIARACALVHSANQRSIHVAERADQVDGAEDGERSPFQLQLPPHIASRAVRDASSAPLSTATPAHTTVCEDDGSIPQAPAVQYDPDYQDLQAAAEGLMAELVVWDQQSNFTPLHPRTQYGNHCYRYAMRIWLLRHVYGVGRDDGRIVKAVASIIELCKELVAQYGSINWLTWPILIAGFQLTADDPARQTVSQLLCTFGPHACFDNSAAVRMIKEFWRLQDLDLGSDVTYWQVLHRLECRPFLD